MPIGMLFWAIFLIYLIFGGLWWRNGAAWAYGWNGSFVLVMVLLFLLGWAEFGFILQGGKGSPFR